MSNRFVSRHLISLACLAALLALSGTSMAQVYKCVGKDGKVSYEQSPCAGTSSAGVAPNLQGAGRAQAGTSSPAVPGASNAYDASIKARIKELVADKDYTRAQAIAVTDEHRKMVVDAKKANEAEAQEKVKAGAARGATDCLIERIWATRDGVGYWAERRTCK